MNFIFPWFKNFLRNFTGKFQYINPTLRQRLPLSFGITADSSFVFFTRFSLWQSPSIDRIYTPDRIIIYLRRLCKPEKAHLFSAFCEIPKASSTQQSQTELTDIHFYRSAILNVSMATLPPRAISIRFAQHFSNRSIKSLLRFSVCTLSISTIVGE